ncbi:MAG: hypothetical protein M1837_004710 [Sclerophora amabilis]|nr:MAG: hypothetical protein M1837_004710 [Sclerophora amabilis]
MGFTTGFVGGVTLTTTILYLTLAAHRQNRVLQARSLHSQAALLNSTFEPPAPLALEERRSRRVGFVETAKDRWNEEIEGTVRWVQRVDWVSVRQGIENGASKILANVREKVREERKS